MLQKLGDHIEACRKRAAECEAASKSATNPAERKNLEDLSVRWELVASLERFLVDQQCQTFPSDVEKLPKNGPEP